MRILFTIIEAININLKQIFYEISVDAYIREVRNGCLIILLSIKVKTFFLI